MFKTKTLTLALICVATANFHFVNAQTGFTKKATKPQTHPQQKSASVKSNTVTGKPNQVSGKPKNTLTQSKTGSGHVSLNSAKLNPGTNKSKQTPARTTTTVTKSQSTAARPGVSSIKSTLSNKPVTQTESLVRASSQQSFNPTYASNTSVTQIAASQTMVTATAVNLLRDKQAVTTLRYEPAPGYSPKVIDVTDQTIRLGGGKKEELMFGFAAGDKIIFNFEEADGKDVKEIEVIEYPTLSRFSDYKTSRVKNKEIIVTQQSVFIFRLKNSSLSKRICKVRIQRMPASPASENFNSSVSWVTKQDTVWTSYTTDVAIGYDTSYIPKTKRVLVKTELEEQVIADNLQRVPSMKIENRASVVLAMPLNNRSPYRTSRVVSWVYWIGVGEEGNRAWQQNVRNVRSKNMDYYSPLGAYANGGMPYLALPKSGQQVNFFVVDQANRDLFMQKQPFRYIDDGKSYGNYRKFVTADQCQGTYYLCLENNSLLGYMDVHVKVAALIEKTYFEDQDYEEMMITPITEKQIKQQPYIRNTTLPVTGR
jgi:hypothetical protein